MSKTLDRTHARGSMGLVLLAATGCGGAGEETKPGDDHASEPELGGVARGQVSAFGTSTCAIGSDGDITCWGGNFAGRSSAASGPFAKVSVGPETVCGLSEVGDVHCWGEEAMHLVGGYRDVSVGPLGICWVRESGALLCGRSDDPAYVPREPRPGPFARVASGDFFTCGLRPDGSATCWQTRDPAHVHEPEGHFLQVASGSQHVCVLDDAGRVDCWGEDGEGQSRPPEGVFRAIDLGGSQSCGLTDSGAAACWGAVAREPPSDVSFVDVAVSGSHGCGITAEGAPHCWGFGLGALVPTSPAKDGTLGAASHRCADVAGEVRFNCEVGRGWLSPYGLERANSVPFPQQFGSSILQDVWVSSSEATLTTGDTVSALTLYRALDPEDPTARLEGTLAPDTTLVHHSPGNDRFELMVKGTAGSSPESNDWLLTRLLLDGSPAPPVSGGGYGEPGRTCLSCHLMDGRRERTDLLWGLPRPVAPL